MNTCSTCRFFGAHNGIEIWDDDYDAGLGFGPGDTHETDHHACARIIHGNAGQSDFKQVNAEPAVVTDGSGYAARLRVLPTFGCALHEPVQAPSEDDTSNYFAILRDRIQKLEAQIGMDVAAARRGLDEGKVVETWEICQLLMLQHELERIRQRT